MKTKYKSNNNIVYDCKYHIIWCSKYRRPVLVGKVDLKTREWTCLSCNAKHHRDINASIHRVGTSTLRGEVVRATLVA